MGHILMNEAHWKGLRWVLFHYAWPSDVTRSVPNNTINIDVIYVVHAKKVVFFILYCITTLSIASILYLRGPQSLIWLFLFCYSQSLNRILIFHPNNSIRFNKININLSKNLPELNLVDRLEMYKLKKKTFIYIV